MQMMNDGNDPAHVPAHILRLGEMDMGMAYGRCRVGTNQDQNDGARHHQDVVVRETRTMRMIEQRNSQPCNKMPITLMYRENSDWPVLQNEKERSENAMTLLECEMPNMEGALISWTGSIKRLAI